MGIMASETTFDHWKVVFSWGKMRKSRFSQNPLTSRFWAFGFSIYTSSSANFKKDPPWNIFSLSVHAPATSEAYRLFCLCLISAYCQEERRIGPNMSKDWQLRVDSIQAFNFMLGNWCPGKLHKRITRGQGASPYQVLKPTMLLPWG